MHNLWIIFKCLSLIAGCLFMIVTIVAIVETIRDKFRERNFKNKINEIIIKKIDDNDEEKEK